MRAVLVASVLVLHCDHPTAQALDAAGSSSTAAVAKKSPVTCTSDGHYPQLWPLAEASAAVEVERKPGERAILALSDSGNHGAAMMWKIPEGPLKRVRMDLDAAASDDVEGAAWKGGHLFTLTSSGAVRRYTPSPNGDFERDGPAYPIGAPPYVCSDLHAGNCGKNYEGLCLRGGPRPARCAGFAASKTESSLYCVTDRDGILAIDAGAPPIKLALPAESLSDCAFGGAGGPAENVLLVTTNIHGGSTTYVVDEASSGLMRLDVHGLPSNEGIAIDRDGALYQFMDGDIGVSPTLRATCSGWALPAAREP
jgi:hypothetical protein